jgi:D-glycero-alpha-D-manno-heptose-7-phosphate kinase
MPSPRLVVKSTAPVRVADLGGWTDTWFAGHGCVCNLAVAPHVESLIRIFPGEGRVTVHAENFRERFEVGEERYPLIESAVREMPVPEGLDLEISVYSDIPPGASTGTSAAVLVSLVGALDCLTPGRLAAHEVAARAHRIEVETLRQQSGVQDQLASAFGGFCFIEITEYPHAVVSPIPVRPDVAWEIESRLILLFLGRSHDSSQIHETVIRDLEGQGTDARALEDLRAAARRGRDALYAGDPDAYGAAWTENTEAQARLHPELVSPEAKQAIAIAQAHDVVGYKVNGAGGNGGSLTLLCGPDHTVRRRLIEALHEANPDFRCLPVRLSPGGLRRWRVPVDGVLSC